MPKLVCASPGSKNVYTDESPSPRMSIMLIMRRIAGRVRMARMHRLAEFDEPRVDPALQQELLVLVAAVAVHAAARVPRRLIAHVERVMLFVVVQRRDARDQVAVLLPHAPLRAVRLEALDRHAHRHARAAAVAIRTIGEHARAPEAGLDEFGIDVGVDQVARRGDLRARDPPFQVTARIGRRCIELQRGKR